MNNKKHKKMAKAQKPPKPPATAGAALISLSNPAPNTLQWTLPVIPDGKCIVYTYITFGLFDGTTHTKQSGVQIDQLTRPAPITSWENNTGVGDQPIPPGTWSVRVVHYMADKSGQFSYEQTTIDNGTFSDWLDNITFS